MPPGEGAERAGVTGAGAQRAAVYRVSYSDFKSFISGQMGLIRTPRFPDSLLAAQRPHITPAPPACRRHDQGCTCRNLQQWSCAALQAPTAAPIWTSPGPGGWEASQAPGVGQV